MTYTIEFTPRARRDFKALPPEVQKRMQPRINALAEQPRPSGVTALKGEPDLLRLRVGDYRLIYRVAEERRMVVLAKIGHRRDIYKRR